MKLSQLNISLGIHRLKIQKKVVVRSCAEICWPTNAHTPYPIKAIDIPITPLVIDAIAVTYGPGLMGSLLVGVEAAKTLSLLYNKPLIAVNHLAGHVYANNLENDMHFPLLALIISGGHTDIVYMEDDYKFKVLGGTLDDATITGGIDWYYENVVPVQ